MALSALNYNDIADGESITNWTGDTFALEPDIKVQGANSVFCGQTANGANAVNYTNTSFSAISGSHLRLFFNVTYVGNLSPTDPVEVSLFNGSTTTTVVAIANASEYSGGWVDVVLPLDAFGLTGTIQTVTLTVNAASKPRNGSNGYFDNWRTIDGFVVTEGTYDFDQCFIDDDTQKWGIVRRIDGVYFVTGSVLLGGFTNLTTFTSVGETVVFPTRNVSASLYEFSLATITTGGVNIDIESMVCKAVSAALAPVIDMNGSVIDFSIVGSSFTNCGPLDFRPTVSGTSAFTGNNFVDCVTGIDLGLAAVNCTFTRSAAVTLAAGAQLTNCVLESPSADGVVIDNFAQLDNCQFNGTTTATNSFARYTVSGTVGASWNHQIGNAAYIGLAGSYTNEGPTDAALFVDGSGTLNLSIDAGSDIPTIRAASGVTVVVSAAQTKLTFTNIPVGGVFVLYDNDDDPADWQELGTTLLSDTNTSGANLEYQHSSAGDDVIVQFLLPGFEELNESITLLSTDQQLDIGAALVTEVNI